MLAFSIPPELAPFLVEKGSVTVDGVSLTVSALLPDRFEVALIPHTLEMTTLARRAPGDRVNLEVDVIGKYVHRILAARGLVPPLPEERRVSEAKPASQLPEPGRFWIRYVPKAWEPPERPWIHLAAAALGDWGRAEAALPRPRSPGRRRRSTTSSTSRPCRRAAPPPATRRRATG